MSADTPSWALALFAFALATCATPGPNNTMLASSGATFGFRATIPHMLGVMAGFSFMLIAVAFGGGEALRRYPVVHDVLKWVGATYLLWLAFQIATAKPALATPAFATDGASIPGGRRPFSFMKAVLFQWVNPKAWIVVFSAVATYTTQSGIVEQTLALAAIFFCASVPSVALWTLTGVGAARLLRSERAIRIFNIAMAVLLVASLLPLVRGD